MITNYKIKPEEFTGKDVSSLPDEPSMPATELKARFDSPAKVVVSGRINSILDALASNDSADSGAHQIGSAAVTGLDNNDGTRATVLHDQIRALQRNISNAGMMSVGPAGLIANRIYSGTDLTAAFGAEIAAPPYNGNVWAWIQARIRENNFSGINVGDFIPFTCTNGYVIKAEVAGINTYHRFGSPAVPFHIDFISRDCWPDRKAFNRVNYNNGTTVSSNPWLASELKLWLNSESGSVPNSESANPAMIAVDYTSTGVYRTLPAALKDVIVTKRFLAPRRYTEDYLLTDDIGNAWDNAGKLWLPYEVEIIGFNNRESSIDKTAGPPMSGCVQYPIFANNMKRIKGYGDGGASARWHTASVEGNSATNIVQISSGISGSNAASVEYWFPVCFRIT